MSNQCLIEHRLYATCTALRSLPTTQDAPGGLSRVPAPRTSADFANISWSSRADYRRQPIGAVEYKLGRVYVTDVFSSGQQYLGDESWRFVCLTYFSS